MKQLKKFTFIVIVALCLFSLLSCKAPWRTWPEDRLNTRWYSKDPEIEFFIYDGGYGYGTLVHNEEILEIEFSWGGGTNYGIYNKNTEPERSIIHGTYNMKKGYVLLKISYDHIFDNKYETIKLYYESIK